MLPLAGDAGQHGKTHFLAGPGQSLEADPLVFACLEPAWELNGLSNRHVHPTA